MYFSATVGNSIQLIEVSLFTEHTVLLLIQNKHLHTKSIQLAKQKDRLYHEAATGNVMYSLLTLSETVTYICEFTRK